MDPRYVTGSDDRERGPYHRKERRCDVCECGTTGPLRTFQHGRSIVHACEDCALDLVRAEAALEVATEQQDGIPTSQRGEIA